MLKLLVTAGAAGLLLACSPAATTNQIYAELPGYDAYMAKVRYRLIPSVW